MFSFHLVELYFATINAFASKTNPVILLGHNDSVYSIACSPDGKQLVSGSNGETIRTWKSGVNTNNIPSLPEPRNDIVISSEKLTLKWAGVPLTVHYKALLSDHHCKRILPVADKTNIQL